MNITLAQLNFTIGDFDGNYKKIADVVETSKKSFKNDVIVFSELAITGYPPLDLIERPGFYEKQMEIMNKIIELTKDGENAIVIGYFEKNIGVGKPFYNSLAFIHDGKIACNYRKRLLPTYDIFDESRHFEAGDKAVVYEYKEVRFGLLICEDMWNDKAIAGNKFLYPINPIKETVDLNPDVILSINASPSNVGKPEYRVEKFTKIANEYDVPIFYVNQVGGNDDIVFDGNSFVANPKGNGLKSYLSEEFAEKVSYFYFFEDTEILGINDEQDYSRDLRINDVIVEKDKVSYFYNRQIVLGLRDYFNKNGFFNGIVVGSSGGVDSALVLALAVQAIGKDKVVAITMPSAISSSGSVTDSETLCNNLDIKLYNRPIGEEVELAMKNHNEAFGKSTKSLTKENLQARIRGRILMEYCNEYNFLLLTTGNKSECAVGYSTLYGDQNGGIGPISDLYKNEVWNLCRFINNFYGKEMIPNVIIDKEPSAELYENQKDTDSLPPYNVLDAILTIYIEGNQIDQNIIEKCKEVLKDVPESVIKKVYRMVDNAEFKRRQAPPTIRVHQKAWGSGRRMPIVQKYKN